MKSNSSVCSDDTDDDAPEWAHRANYAEATEDPDVEAAYQELEEYAQSLEYHSECPTPAVLDIIANYDLPDRNGVVQHVHACESCGPLVAALRRGPAEDSTHEDLAEIAAMVAHSAESDAGSAELLQQTGTIPVMDAGESSRDWVAAMMPTRDEPQEAEALHRRFVRPQGKRRLTAAGATPAPA